MKAVVLTCLYVNITAGPVGSEGSSSLALEQEKYFSSIVAATPMGECYGCRLCEKVFTDRFTDGNILAVCGH